MADTDTLTDQRPTQDTDDTLRTRRQIALATPATPVTPRAPPLSGITPLTTPPSFQPAIPPLGPVAPPRYANIPTPGTPPPIPTPNYIVDPTGRNNPGNIKIPGTNQFQRFPTPQAGFDAIGNLVLAYQDQHGLNTVAGIISRYSPPSENDTTRLIANASARMGVSPDQPLDFHDPAVRQKMVNALVAQEQQGGAGGLPPQQYIPASQTPGLNNRPPAQWGKPPEGGYEKGPPGSMPALFDIPRIMAQGMTLLPLLSLFTRGGFQMAATGFASYVDGYQRGQLLKQRLAKDQWQNGLNETIARMEKESIEAGDAFATYGNNEEALQEALGQIAHTYGDDALSAALGQGGSKAAEALLQKRDAYYTDLNKVKEQQQRDADAHQKAVDEHQKAAQERQDVADQNVAIAGLDRQFQQENPNATPDQLAIAHQQHVNQITQKPTAARAATPEQQADIDAADASTRQWVQDEKAAGRDPTPDQIAIHRADELDRRRQRPQTATPPRPGSVDSMMEDWLEQQKQDPKRWSGGAAGQGTYTPPTPEETARERGHITQLSSKPPVSARQISERLMIAANDVAKTLTAIKQLPAGATLGWTGGAQTALGPGLTDNMRKALANAATTQASQILSTLSNGLGRSLAILAAAGSATGLVGLSNMLAKDVPAANDKGYTVLAKLADMRQIAEAALEVIQTDPNLGDEQKAELGKIKQQIVDAVPFTTSEVVQKAFNPTDANMADLARKLGVLQDQKGPLPPGVTVEVH